MSELKHAMVRKESMVSSSPDSPYYIMDAREVTTTNQDVVSSYRCWVMQSVLLSVNFDDALGVAVPICLHLLLSSEHVTQIEGQVVTFAKTPAEFELLYGEVRVNFLKNCLAGHGGREPETKDLLLKFSPADFSPVGLSPAGFSPAGFSPAGFSPAGFSPAGFESRSVEKSVVHP